MQTIINFTDSYTDLDSVIFPITDIKYLKKDLFSEEEIEYIRSFHKEHKQKVFSFNRYSNWVFVVFIEKDKDQSIFLENYRALGSKMTIQLNAQKINQVVIADHENKKKEVLAFAEGLALRNYQFLKYVSKKAEKLNSLNTILIHSPKVTEADIEILNIVIDATLNCRTMVNEPVAYLNAAQLAETFEMLGAEAGCKVEVLNMKKIESLKMGGLLAVNKGSVDPPTFTIMEWKPENAVNKKPYVFVGKGVVYDTGGMNIKTGNSMYDMKMDMAGGAAAGNAVYAIAKARIPVHVIALIPATDNRTHGNAYVNGDIITMYDGTKVEVINTDAEGRMILADALSYAKKYDPELVIDIATLTGSAMRAIGIHGIAVMQSKAEDQIKKLKISGNEVYERLAELPFWKEYADELKSEVADIKHLAGTNGGAITAGKFLAHFTDYPYIHLDIAGPAYAEKVDRYYTFGGTGVGVRLLFNFILELAKKD